MFSCRDGEEGTDGWPYLNVSYHCFEKREMESLEDLRRGIRDGPGWKGSDWEVKFGGRGDVAMVGQCRLNTWAKLKVECTWFER